MATSAEWQPALTELAPCLRVRWTVGLMSKLSHGRDIKMRRLATLVGWWLGFGLSLAAQTGCSALGLRGRGEHPPPSPERLDRVHQISEHAQAAIDRGDNEQARIDLEQLVREEPESAEA